MLWDLTGANASSIPSSGFERIQGHVSRLPAAARKRNIAIVVSRELGCGLSRRSQAYAEMLGVQTQYHIGYSLEEARAWLDSGPGRL